MDMQSISSKFWKFRVIQKPGQTRFINQMLITQGVLRSIFRVFTQKESFLNVENYSERIRFAVWQS
jgi:hypothetical protein